MAGFTANSPPQLLQAGDHHGEEGEHGNGTQGVSRSVGFRPLNTRRGSLTAFPVSRPTGGNGDGTLAFHIVTLHYAFAASPRFPNQEMQMHATDFLGLPFRSRGRALVLAAIVLTAGLLAVERPGAVWAEDDAACPVTDLGTLSADTDQLATEGRWTTEDCDSAFRQGSDAHTYRFKVAEPGRIRIGLTSADADSYLYLMAEDGSRIADNDDGAPLLGARVERDLEAGTYLVEATTVGGRSRGPADFSLSVGYVAGCDPVHLGALEPGTSLTASGIWTIDTCGSRFVASHPAYTYAFDLPQDGRVRIDLASEEGDPVLSLISPARGVIGANDDGGARRNSRLDQYLASGPYLIEATTYSARDRNRILADFTLTIRFVESDSFLIKVEALEIPDVVIAGEPFTVHYRVGNVGHTDLPEGLSAVVVTAAPGGTWDITESVPAAGGHWGVGVSYHSREEAATPTSTLLPPLRPLSLNIPEPGDSYVVLVIFTDNDETEEEVDFHFIERVLTVHSGPTFGPTTVKVDGSDLEVAATADEEGMVTNSVTSVADPEVEVDTAAQAKAIYTAAVDAFLLEGILERPGLRGLAASGEPLETILANAASTTLYGAFAELYAEVVSTSGVEEALASGEVVSPVVVEDLILDVADRVSRQYAWLAASWSALEEQVASGEGVSFEQASTLQSELAYAERILAPFAAAGRAVQAAREAEAGWQDPSVQAMVRELAAQARCDSRSSLLGYSFLFGGVEDVKGLEAIDEELRGSLPTLGYGSDAALCAASSVDSENAWFIHRLGIFSDPVVGSLHMAEGPPLAEDAPAPPYELRIIARLTEDGRVEHGVQLTNGLEVLPPGRLLPVDAPVGRWYVSGEVEVEGNPIGLILAQRLADGRVELGFRNAAGDRVSPDIRYLPADLPIGAWVRSSVIEVLPPPSEGVAPE